MVRYIQFDDKGNNVLFDNCFLKDPKITEKEIVKRLLSAIRETPYALAVAANQIGIKAPYTILRNPIRVLEGYKSLTSTDGINIHLFCRDPEYVIIKEPLIWFYSDGESYQGRECCLSCDSLGEVTTDRKTEIGITAQFLDIQAYNKNRNNLLWVRKTVDHIKNLAAQILQHEIEHLHGAGIWNHKFGIPKESLHAQ